MYDDESSKDSEKSTDSDKGCHSEEEVERVGEG